MKRPDHPLPPGDALARRALAEAEASAQPLTLDAGAELLRALAPPEEADHTDWIIGRAHAMGTVKGLLTLAHAAHDYALTYAEEHPARVELLHRFRFVAAGAANELATRPTVPAPPGEA